MKKLDKLATDILFTEARTYSTWRSDPVTDSDIREMYELAKWGPTTANTNPARFVFIRSPEGKERLRPHLAAGNVDKTMTAPCTVIMAWDTEFYEMMPQLFPSRDLRSSYVGKPDLIADTAFRSATLQASYMMLAARALGFDCGAMSGFDKAGVDKAFLEERRWKSNFLCNIGHGDAAALFPRNPRLDFDQACLDL
jgi:3-hydroxypropanoate dehydrogenase